MRCAVRELLDLDVTGVCVCVQATLKALLGGKHLSMAERAILAQLLPEEQAGLVQQLADSKKGVAAERIADPLRLACRNRQPNPQGAARKRLAAVAAARGSCHEAARSRPHGPSQRC